MSMDRYENLDDETRKKVEELQKVTREKDGDVFFSEAQFNLGSIYFENNNLEKALEAWNKIEPSDNQELYAQLRVDIGVIFKKIGNNETALKEWSKVRFFDNPEAYAYAKFYTGRVLHELNKNAEAIESYKSIKRENSLELFIEAQFRVAEISLREDNVNEAIISWRNIERSDNPFAYAKAQFSIGSILLEKATDREQALEAWGSIKRSDDLKIFADAQFGIGCELKNDSLINEALRAWYNVRRSDNPVAYAKSQFNIGVTLMELNNFEGALLAFRNIENSDVPEIYESVQHTIKKLIDDMSFNSELLEKLNSINRFEEPKAYAQAQYKIGKKLILSNSFGDVIGAKTAFDNAKEFYPYESYCYSKICDLLVNEGTSNIGDKALNLIELVKKVISILTLDFDGDSFEINGSNENSISFKSPERKLAHYTSIDTTNKLLNSNNCSPSPFRLNTVSNFNDPSEGQLLNFYLNNDGESEEEKEYSAPEFDENLHAFISCFTFNHDSLNQFRLYGKTDNQEASGVSLVLTKEFFQTMTKMDGIPFLSNIANTQSSSHVIDKQEGLFKINEETRKVQRLPVIRCVYIDPTSEYIHLAQRNKLTFFREFKRTKIQQKTVSTVNEQRTLIFLKKNKAELEWEAYEKGMSEKTVQFKTLFLKLKELYKEIISDISELDKIYSNSLGKVEALLDEILVPLRYLIKHSAFQEEQECRLIYITALDNPEVKMTFGKFLYVEYEPDVKSNLDKLYIAPSAKKYQPYIANLLCDKKDVIVELSNNPYRQT